MIDLFAQATSPTGAPSAGTLSPLVVAVTSTMAATSLILVQVLRGWKKWKPVGEFFPNSAIRFAALFAAGAMVLAFYFLRTPDTVKTLTWTLICGAFGALASLITYNIFHARWVFTQMQGLDSNGVLVTTNVLGGFLTPGSRAKLLADPNLTEQMLIDGCGGNLDRVWRRGSRGIVASFFLLAFVGLVTFASLTATAIGLFTLLSSGVIHSERLQVRVPANVSLSRFISANEINFGNGGFIAIPAGFRAVFVSATTNRWTNDQLQNIEQRLSTTQPYTVDVTRLIAAHKSKEVDYDAGAFTKWMESEFDQLVKEGMTSLKSTNPIPFFKELMQQYVREGVAPVITDLARRSETHHELDLRNEQSIVPFVVRRALWKRIIYIALKEHGQIQPMLGPYVDVTGSNPSAVPGGGGLDGSAAVPCPTAPRASLVGGLLGSTLLSVPLGTATPFSKSGDTIENRGDISARARLGINDSIPDDNGDGYADVTYRIEPIR